LAIVPRLHPTSAMISFQLDTPAFKCFWFLVLCAAMVACTQEKNYTSAPVDAPPPVPPFTVPSEAKANFYVLEKGGQDTHIPTDMEKVDFNAFRWATVDDC
jgi:hypothetical protein